MDSVIHAEVDPDDGCLYAWRGWKDKRDDHSSPAAIAAAYRARIMESPVRRGFIRQEPVDVATALLAMPGFEILGEGGGEFTRPWPSGIGPCDMTGVRVVGAADEPLIFDLLKRTGLAGDDHREDVLRIFEPNGFNIMLAEDGRDVGFGSIIHGNGAGWVSYVAVLESARSRGLGTRIMAILLAETDKVPLERIDLAAGDHAAALRLYKRFGFVRRGPLTLRLKFDLSRESARAGR